MPGKKCFAIVIAVAILILSSCGGVRKINLAYTSDPVSHFPKANAGQEVIVNKFQDSRSEKQQVGVANNNFGTVFFTVEALNDVATWVTTALATELQKAGFKVASGENVDNPEKFVINGNISEMSAHGIISEMRLTVQVAKDYKIAMNNSYSTAGSKAGRVPGAIVYTVDYVKLFDVTLQDLLAEMVPQVITAINQYRE